MSPHNTRINTVKNNRVNYLPTHFRYIFRVRHSLSKKVIFICFNKSPLKMKKNVYYFISKASDIYIFLLTF